MAGRLQWRATMSAVCPQVPVITETETRYGEVDFADVLHAGELLTGTPTITEVTTTDLTLAQKQISTASTTILGETVATGAAVQFLVSGQQAGTTYRVLIQCGTDGNPGTQTIDRVVTFRVEDDA